VTIDYRLTLDYQLQAGWLGPFVHGLQQGRAIARCCSACKKTSFPPIRVCACDNASGEWVTLSGEARIVHRCDGSEGSFALVQFSGADTQTVVRLDAMADTDLVGFLKYSPTINSTDLPTLVLTVHQRGTEEETYG